MLAVPAGFRRRLSPGTSEPAFILYLYPALFTQASPFPSFLLLVVISPPFPFLARRSVPLVCIIQALHRCSVIIALQMEAEADADGGRCKSSVAYFYCCSLLLSARQSTAAPVLLLEIVVCSIRKVRRGDWTTVNLYPREREIASLCAKTEHVLRHVAMWPHVR